jgi:hypothetical protein
MTPAVAISRCLLQKALSLPKGLMEDVMVPGMEDITHQAQLLEPYLGTDETRVTFSAGHLGFPPLWDDTCLLSLAHSLPTVLLLVLPPVASQDA